MREKDRQPGRLREKCTRDWGAYLLSLTEAVFLTMVWFWAFLFRCLPGFTYAQSRRILLGMLLVSVLGGLLIFRRRRTGWTAAVCGILPYGIYTAAVYHKEFPILITAGLSLPLAASGLYALCRYRTVRTLRKRRRTAGHGRRLRRAGGYVRDCLYFSASAFSVGCLALLIYIGADNAFGSGPADPVVKAVVGSSAEDQTLSAQADTLCLLREEEWKELSMEERLNVLQCAANVEASYLGPPHELNVAVDEDELAKSTLAFYDEDIHTICVNADCVKEDSSRDAVDSICHEAFHALQRCLVEAYEEADEQTRNLLLFRRIGQYREEFNAYRDGLSSENYGVYYEQACEADSRAYAEERAEQYYEAAEKAS